MLTSGPVSKFVTRQCHNPDCRLRFPAPADTTLGERCPHCRNPTAVDVHYDSLDAREPSALPSRSFVGVSALLDNVRSLRNVGSMFRSADGAGLTHMYLGGFTPTPEHPQMAKTALGAEATVGWSSHRDGAALAEQLQGEGQRLWALEGGPMAQDFFAVAATEQEGPPVVLVFGHEVSGVDPRIVRCCERVLRLPMLGYKGSLNVSVAFGIAVYNLRFACPSSPAGP